MPELNLFTLISLAVLLAFTKQNPIVNSNIIQEQQSTTSWKVTVYYTPVEQYHDGDREEISDGTNSLGAYPSTFLELVRLEGVGRLSSGSHAGSYLHWTPQLGYWLTSEPLDAQGNMLIPFRSAAAHSRLNYGTRFKITDCGYHTANNNKLTGEACDTISSKEWIVTDRFHEDGKTNHLDLYIGEEDSPNFLQTNPHIFSVEGVNILLLN